MVRNYIRDCAVLVGTGDRPEHLLAAGDEFAPGASRVNASIIKKLSKDDDPYHGFSVNFPLGTRQLKNGEEIDGVRSIRGHDYYCFTIKIPRGADVDYAEASDEVMNLVPSATPGKKNTLITVRLPEGIRAHFLDPDSDFHNPDEPEMEGWLNWNMEIFPGIRLLEFLGGDVFYLVTDQFPDMARVNWDETGLPERVE